MTRSILLLVVLILSGCASRSVDDPLVAGRAITDPMFQFDGTWEGAIDGFGGPNLVDGAGVTRQCRLVIGPGSMAKAYQQLDSGWSEVKPGSFWVIHWASQALVRSITAGHDNDGTWVEGWTFLLVHRDKDSVVAYWLRTVNNLDLPQTNDDFHFGWGFSGVLYRALDGG
jgi:uncharacterized lipoprotein NlpE involved in copper resistance